MGNVGLGDLRRNLEIVRTNRARSLELGARFFEATKPAESATDIGPNVFVQRIETRGFLLNSDRILNLSLAAFYKANREEGVRVVRRPLVSNLQLSERGIVISQAIIVEHTHGRGAFSRVRSQAHSRFRGGPGPRELRFGLLWIKIFL